MVKLNDAVTLFGCSSMAKWGSIQSTQVERAHRRTRYLITHKHTSTHKHRHTHETRPKTINYNWLAEQSDENTLNFTILNNSETV